MLVRRVRIVVIAVAVLGLSIVGTAQADKERIHLTKAGQAAARAAVVTRADLGTTAVWTGGRQKPDLSSTPPCPSFDPKQSDLVLNGAARTTWKSNGIRIDSLAQVLQTRRMVRLDWRRTVLAPQVLPCLRVGLTKQLDSATRLVSIDRIGFPKLATYTAAVRAVLDVKTPTGTVRVMSDVVLFGAGRSELTLTVTAPLAARAPVRQAEIRLARLLVSRIVV
jgi:hypothetical protein